jgi:MFS transporter, PPP family, 3-phenylpropionic acid transporter
MSPLTGAREPLLAGALGAFYFAAFAALGLQAPYFPLWLEAHGFEGLAMGCIAALTPAMSFLGPPLVGALADARGARGNLLSAACALSFSGMAGLCLAELRGAGGHLAVVFSAMLVFAACRSPIIMLADRITLEQGGNYGRRRVWGSIGFMLAAAGFGRWCPPESWRWLPGLIAVTLACAFVQSLRLPRQRAALPAELGAKRRWLPGRAFLPFAVCTALSAASASSYDLCGALFFRDLGASGDTIGLLYGVAVLAEVGLLATAGSLLSRVGPERMLVVSYAAAAVRWLGMASLGSTGLAFVLQPLHAFSFALTWMSSLEYVRRASGPSDFGGAQGSFMAAQAVGGVLGMLSWGPLYAASGGAAVFLGAASLSGGATLLALGLLVLRPPSLALASSRL